MHLKVELRELEQHLELLEGETAVCRRLELELQQCLAQEMLREDPAFWEREVRFLSDERENIRNRQQVLSMALEEFQRANFRMHVATDEAKHILMRNE